MKVEINQKIIKRGADFLLLFIFIVLSSCESNDRLNLEKIERTIPNIKIKSFNFITDTVAMGKKIDFFPPYHQIKVFCNYFYRRLSTYSIGKSNFEYYELDCLKEGKKVKLSYYKHIFEKVNIDFIEDIKKIEKNDCFSGEGKGRYSFVPFYIDSNSIGYLKIDKINFQDFFIKKQGYMPPLHTLRNN